MKIINDGLPAPVFEWIMATAGEYSRGDSDISVTELIGPPRIRMLKKQNAEKIEVKASSLLNVSLGSAVHKGIDEACQTGISERRLQVEVQGWVISGGMDNYHDGLLQDWKTCNKWKTVLCDKGVIEEFEQQLNIYAHILRENGEPVTKLKIFALFKDWNAAEHRSYLTKGKIFAPGKKAGYPEKEWLYFDIKLWEPAVAKAYLESRVKAHQSAEVGALPRCSAEETWGGKRCAKYCDPAAFCSQYKQARLTGIIGGDD